MIKHNKVADLNVEHNLNWATFFATELLVAIHISNPRDLQAQL